MLCRELFVSCKGRTVVRELLRKVVSPAASPRERAPTVSYLRQCRAIWRRSQGVRDRNATLVEKLLRRMPVAVAGGHLHRSPTHHTPGEEKRRSLSAP